MKMKFSDLNCITREGLGDSPDRDAFHSLLKKPGNSGMEKPVRLLGCGVQFMGKTTRREDPQTLLDL